jgi:RimJ/RimL family protein N-acetyltransferase
MSSTPPPLSTYSRFYSGDTIDLCVPSAKAVLEDGWADWLNDQQVCEFLDHGIFPNHVEDQLAFVEALRKRERFALLICTKEPCKAIGVISLSAIDFRKRSAQISLVISKPGKGLAAGLAALEAMALVTRHGFEVMGLNRIWAGQAYPGLASWNRMLEVLGYRTEGVLRDAFARGHRYHDTVMISCLYRRYQQICASRGSLWPGVDAIKQVIKALPRIGFAEKLDKAIRELEREHFGAGE